MANISLYNPFSEMMSLREAMDRLLEDSVISPRSSSSMMSGRSGMANLYETGDGYTLQLPMPGVKPEDVDITVQEDVVNIKWEVNVATPENATMHWQGFRSGKYQQSFTLPAPIEAAHVEASYKDGILMLQLPKAEHAKAHTIKINTNASNATTITAGKAEADSKEPVAAGK